MNILVLGGGGANGWYELGVLRRLIVDLGYDYDAIVGNSVGCLIATILCMHEDIQVAFEHLKRVFDGVTTKSIYKNHFPGGAIGKMIGFFFKQSLFSTKPLKKLVAKELDADKVRASGRLLRVVAVDLEDGSLRTFDQDSPHLVKAILASSSYPTFFPPEIIDGRAYTDGGIRDIVPLKTAVDLAGESEATIDIVSTEAMELPTWELEDKSVFEYFPRILEIQNNEIHKGDIHIDDLMEEIKRYREELDPKTRKMNIKVRHIIQPAKSLGDGLDFDRAHVELAEVIGYNDALRLIQG